MASNHTERCGELEVKAIQHLWQYISKERQAGITKKQIENVAKWGGFSASNILEQAISDTNNRSRGKKKFARSNEQGKDFTDHSDAKYLSAQRYGHGTYKGKQIYVDYCSLSQASTKNKVGALRIFITHKNHHTGIIEFRMFVLPYPEWKKLAVKKNGQPAPISFYFSAKDGDLTDATKRLWGKYEVHSFEDFCRYAK